MVFSLALQLGFDNILIPSCRFKVFHIPPLRFMSMAMLLTKRFISEQMLILILHKQWAVRKPIKAIDILQET